jgi:hypothetical protein
MSVCPNETTLELLKVLSQIQHQKICRQVSIFRFKVFKAVTILMMFFWVESLGGLDSKKRGVSREKRYPKCWSPATNPDGDSTQKNIIKIFNFVSMDKT